MQISEIGVHHRLFGQLPKGAACGLGIAACDDEGQLEHLGAREAARRVARQRPDDIDRAVDGLVDQLWRRATQLHRGKARDLDPPA